MRDFIKAPSRVVLSMVIPNDRSESSLKVKVLQISLLCFRPSKRAVQNFYSGAFYRTNIREIRKMG